MLTGIKSGLSKCIKSWLTLILLLLLLGSTSGCVGPRVVVVPSDRTVVFVSAGQTITATNDAVLIGQALWLELNEALSQKLP